MSSREEGRGWIIVVLAMVALSAAAVVAYLLAPYDPPPNERADTGAPGTVAVEHRIIAVRPDGALVIVDQRDGGLSEVVTTQVEGTVSVLETTASRKVAYVAREDGPAIDLVRLRSGDAVHHANGRTITIGPMAFPQLARTIPRPEAEQLAFVEVRGPQAITVENLTTGNRRTLESAFGRGPQEIEDLTLSPFNNRLFGIAEGGQALFRLDLDLVETLDQAQIVDAPSGVDRYVDITPYRDGVAAIVERSDGATDLVEIDRKTLEPVDILYEAVPDEWRFEGVDADEKATAFLLVTAQHELLTFHPATDDAPEPLADGIALAAW